MDTSSGNFENGEASGSEIKSNKTVKVENKGAHGLSGESQSQRQI